MGSPGRWLIRETRNWLACVNDFPAAARARDRMSSDKRTAACGPALPASHGLFAGPCALSCPPRCSPMTGPNHSDPWTKAGLSRPVFQYFSTCAMPVLMRKGRLGRQNGDLTMAHAALGDDVVGERFHLSAASAQHRHLEATFAVDMNVKRCLCEIVMLMKVTGQALGQFPRSVIIDVAQRRDAMTIAGRLRTDLVETASQQIAKRFRAVGIAPMSHECVHLGQEAVVDRDRQALHGPSPNIASLYVNSINVALWISTTAFQFSRLPLIRSAPNLYAMPTRASLTEVRCPESAMSTTLFTSPDVARSV